MSSSNHFSKALYFQTLANQKLSFSRRLLSLCPPLNDELAIEERLQQMAILDSAVAQQYAALRYFLFEMATEYQLTLNPKIFYFNEFEAVFAKADVPVALWEELVVLKKQRNSWLATLLIFFEEPLMLAERFKHIREEDVDSDTAESHAKKSNLITTVNVSDESSNVGQLNPFEEISAISDQLQGVIDRYRAQLVED